MDNSNLSLQSTKSFMKRPSKQSSSKADTSNIPESQNQLPETSESDTSEDIIEDVKVCDICGDAGLEEKLAICTRCSDGAEHTYCMQKKMKELPEGDWLCEECKFKEETDCQNVDKLEVVAEALMVQQSIKANQNAKSDYDDKCLPELDTKALNSVEKVGSERPLSPQISSKRDEDGLEVDLKNRKMVLGSSIVSAGTADCQNKSLLREGSLCNLGADKAIQVNPAESQNHTINISSFARSHTFAGSNSSKMLDPLQASRGPLSKSFSFNNSNLKPKVQYISCIPPHKQNLSRETNDTRKGQVKKMSESASFKSIRAGPSNIESITRSQPLHSLQTEDHRGLKERNMLEKKHCMPERPLVNPAAGNPAVGHAFGNMHSKVGPEIGTASESKVLDVNKGPRDKDNLGCNEGKASYISKSFGRSSSSLTGQKPFQPVAREDIHEVSGAADRSCGILNAPSQRTTHQAVETSHGNDKCKDGALLGIPKQGGSGILRCRKCNETGHPTQFCSIDKLPVSALKPLADRNVRDQHNRINKTKDAADPHILKSTLQKDPKLQYHSDKASIPSANVSYEAHSKEIQSGSSSCLGISSNVDRTCGQAVVRSSIDDPNKRATSVDVNLQAPQYSLPHAASVPTDLMRASVIPQLEFIWQGGFEVLRSGRLLKSCEGVQAHLSTFASPKVLEAATKFPCSIQLEEVTYLSAWPFQYQGHILGEHNIALFFFAKDIESYEKNYSKLLDDMIKNDLALKGNIAGAELLVFPSNKLPWNSQRWNRLFFLWGVFIGRRHNCSDALQQPDEKPSKPSLNLEQPIQDLHFSIAEVSISQEFSSENKEKPTWDKSNEFKEVKHSTFENLHSTSPGLQMALPYSGVENEPIPPNNIDSDGIEVFPPHNTEKMEEEGGLMKGDAFWGKDSSKLTDLRPNRKRSLQTAIATKSHAADATSQSSGEPIHLNEMLDFPPIDDRRERKKMKPHNREHVDCNHLVENFSSALASNVHPYLNHSVDGKMRMPKSSSTSESSVFPWELGTRHSKVTRSLDRDGLADIPNLELALGAKKKLPEEELSPLPYSDAGDTMSASLSLSLAFHPPDNEP